MDKSARRRWLILLSLLGATIAAIFLAPEEGGSTVEPRMVRVPPHATNPQPSRVAMAAVLTEEAGADPFTAHGWTPPEPEPEPSTAPPKPVVAGPVSVAAPPPPPETPPLPFKYVGKFSDDTGGVIYLSRGDQTLLAHAGDMLEGTYKVLGVDASSIEFEYLPTQTKQTLPIPSAVEQ